MPPFESNKSSMDAATVKGTGVDHSQFDALASLKQLLQLTAADKNLTGHASQNAAFLTFDTSIYDSPSDSRQSLTAKPDATKNAPDARIAAEHKTLTAWAAKNPDVDKVRFEKDMQGFEQRAHTQHLSNDEIVKTYNQIERLATAKGDTPLSARDRAHLAQEIAHNAADPTTIGQGAYNTCSVAALESRTYTRTPSDAARLVTDVALNKTYRATDGTTVNIEPQAHQTPGHWPTNDDSRERSHASEIFQVTAANLKYAKLKDTTHQDIRYEQTDINTASDSGERLWNYTGEKKEVIDETDSQKPPTRAPGFDGGDIASVSNQITGKTESEIVLQANANPESGVTSVVSQDDLEGKLTKLKDAGNLPVVVWVDTSNEPFYTDSQRGVTGGTGGGHFVTVTDYDTQTHKVCIDNQWDKKSDHDQKNSVDSHDLFIAMNAAPAAKNLLQSDVDKERKQGVYDPATEADLARHRANLKGAKPAETDAETIRIQNEIQKHEKDNGKTDADKKGVQELNALIHQEPSYAAQMRLMTRQHDLGLMTDADYDQQLLNIAVSAKRADGGAKVGTLKWKFDQADTKELNIDLQKLPQDQRDMISKTILAQN